MSIEDKRPIYENKKKSFSAKIDILQKDRERISEKIKVAEAGVAECDKKIAECQARA